MKKILIVFALILISGIILTLSRMPSSQPEELEEEKCLITINGQNYDVTTLRATHPGGDIYVCDSDMTETFNSQHGLDYNRLEEYLISP